MTAAAPIFRSVVPATETLGRKFFPKWTETRLKVVSPDRSIRFYEKHFGFKLVLRNVTKSNQNLVEYHLMTVRNTDKQMLETNEKPQMVGTSLVLCHNTNDSSDVKVNNGNEEPYRNFGHIAVNCNDVYKSCSKLEQNGVSFRKRPDEGRMKGLAFALDPDGYWIEICSRGPEQRWPEEFNLSQTMIRIKDPKLSIPFYRDVLGMTVVREMHMNDFSNYFLSSLPESEILQIESQVGSTGDQQLLKDYVKVQWEPCLELTFNHGTEIDQNFNYHPPTESPIGFQGLSFKVPKGLSISFGVECEKIIEERFAEASGMRIEIVPAKEDQRIPACCRIIDPDGYPIFVTEAE